MVKKQESEASVSAKKIFYWLSSDIALATWDIPSSPSCDKNKRSSNLSFMGEFLNSFNLLGIFLRLSHPLSRRLSPLFSKTSRSFLLTFSEAFSPSKFPKNALFIPEGAKDFENFYVFHIQNKGKPFPKDSKLINGLTKCPELGERGFGLYFTGLVSRFLKAPVNIKSNEDLTTISFYHPIYVE